MAPTSGGRVLRAELVLIVFGSSFALAARFAGSGGRRLGPDLAQTLRLSTAHARAHERDTKVKRQLFSISLRRKSARRTEQSRGGRSLRRGWWSRPRRRHCGRTGTSLPAIRDEICAGSRLEMGHRERERHEPLSVNTQKARQSDAHRFNCRTKEATLECLKSLASTSVAKAVAVKPQDAGSDHDGSIWTFVRSGRAERTGKEDEALAALIPSLF